MHSSYPRFNLDGFGAPSHRSQHQVQGAPFAGLQTPSELTAILDAHFKEIVFNNKNPPEPDLPPIIPAQTATRLFKHLTLQIITGNSARDGQLFQTKEHLAAWCRTLVMLGQHIDWAPQSTKTYREMILCTLQASRYIKLDRPILIQVLEELRDSCDPKLEPVTHTDFHEISKDPTSKSRLYAAYKLYNLLDQSAFPGTIMQRAVDLMVACREAGYRQNTLRIFRKLKTLREQFGLEPDHEKEFTDTLKWLQRPVAPTLETLLKLELGVDWLKTAPLKDQKIQDAISIFEEVLRLIPYSVTDTPKIRHESYAPFTASVLINLAKANSLLPIEQRRYSSNGLAHQAAQLLFNSGLFGGPVIDQLHSLNSSI